VVTSGELAVEVYDDVTLPAGAYPGDETVSADAEAGCVDRFEAVVGTDGRTFGTLRDSRE
jgi:hypothetical protein